MADPDNSTGAPAPGEVTFDTGCMGCLVILLVICAGLFGIAAFDSVFFADLADSRARRNPLAAFAPFRWGGVNIAVLLLVAYILFETVRIGRKLIDPRAVWIDGDKLRFHRSLRQDPVALSSLAEVSHISRDIRSILVLRLLGGRKIEVPMVDHDAAAAFVAEVERHRTRAGGA